MKVTIERLGHLGDGIAQGPEGVIYVPGMLPGEEVEASIQDALTSVMRGKTVLAIAHRLSTIAEMDRIVVLDAGRVVEQGSHAELLAQAGLYARYWNRQSGGFIGIDQKEAAE